MALIASRVTVIYMSADETLLVAQQNHDLEVANEECVTKQFKTFDLD